MDRRQLVLGLAGLLCSGGLVGCHANHVTSTAHPVHQPQKTQRPLTLAALQRHPKLAYASVIYYAVKHTDVQRWQEVSDFKLGWQVETERVQGTKRYSVWPDAHIQESQKKLEPNWFTLKGQRVTYQSFVVHSDGDYTVVHTTLSRVVQQINHDHAAQRVRHMINNLTILEK